MVLIIIRFWVFLCGSIHTSSTTTLDEDELDVDDIGMEDENLDTVLGTEDDEDMLHSRVSLHFSHVVHD